MNDLIYRTVNNGVYRAGFAQSQAAYEEAFDQLFATLDRLEERVASGRYLLGDRLSEADLRRFPTLIRFDVACYCASRCNLERLVDYPIFWLCLGNSTSGRALPMTVDLEIYKRG